MYSTYLQFPTRHFLVVPSLWVQTDSQNLKCQNFTFYPIGVWKLLIDSWKFNVLKKKGYKFEASVSLLSHLHLFALLEWWMLIKSSLVSKFSFFSLDFS